MTKSEIMSLRLTAELRQALQQHADITGKSQTEIITVALRRYLGEPRENVDVSQCHHPQAKTSAVRELQQRVLRLEQEIETMRLIANQAATTSQFCITALQTVLQNAGSSINLDRVLTEQQSPPRDRERAE